MTKEESRKLAQIAVHALESKKGEHVEVIEIDEISPIADYFVIASGSNANQCEALADAVEEEAAKAGFTPDHVEGHRSANWTLIDYKGVVVHVFDDEARAFYDLARVWQDGKKLDPDTMQPLGRTDG